MFSKKTSPPTGKSAPAAAKHAPTIFVVMGVTGDLTAKKIVPALFSLFEEGKLPPRFHVLGISRRDWTDGDLRRHVEAILNVKAKNASRASIEKFLKLVVYHKIEFGSLEHYEALRDALQKMDDEYGMCSNKLFYLSVPPQFYGTILENLHQSGAAEPCGPDEGWTRIVVEKPFGHDEATAKALDKQLAKLFSEDQIYRIDHYLAKEAFQNALVFRFFNNLFEDNWGKDMIEKIYVRELENIGVEDRGAFYDDVGALRDVGQNHLLQMAALATMGEPRDLSANAIRDARAAILETFKPPTAADIKHSTFRAQYEGYHGIKGVAAKSQTETYFRVKGFLNHPRWEGVPIIMEAGKRLMPKGEEEITEIEVVFKHPEPCLCASYRTAAGGSGPSGGHFKNTLVFRQDPRESITVRFWAKKPGFALEIEERIFHVDLRKGERKSQYTEEYEKLLLDCMMGDQTLFVSTREVAAMWRFIDPILAGWKRGAVPLHAYAPDSSAIAAQAAIMDEKPTEDGSSGGGGIGRGATALPREIGVFGLGKMGANVARQLHDKGWRVVVSNRSQVPIDALAAEGFESALSPEGIVEKLSGKSTGHSIGRSGSARAAKTPRVVWLMITAGKGIDDFLFSKHGLAASLRRGDIVIDAGNSFYEDTVRRAKVLRRRGIKFMDVGFSGGPSGARNGGSLMIGGDPKTFKYLEPLFADLSVPGGYSYFGAAGAGHFVKMVHNGIEYGMMQSIAEGFALMKKSPFKLDLEHIANVYQHGSVIESRLVGWLEDAFKLYGKDLKDVSGTVAATGEGEWTIKTGRKFHMDLPAIEDAFKFRVRSKKSPSYMGRILSALRNRFGGHAIKEERGK